MKVLTYLIYFYSDMPIGGPASWGFWVKFTSTPAIVIAGVIGNTLSLIVMKSQSLRHKSYSHYLCALAVFDTITLIIRLVTTINEYYTGILNERGLFHSFNNIGCKVYNFFEHVSYLMSSWLVVLMAMERLIAVCFPFKKCVIRQQSGAAASICCLLLVICFSQSFRLAMIENIPTDIDMDYRICAATDTYTEMYTSLNMYFYQWSLTFFLPVVIVLVCNGLVLYQIFKVRRAIKQKDKNSRRTRAVNKNHKTTCMLLIVSFTYIGTLFPLLVLSTIIDSTIRLKDKTFAWSMYVTLGPFLEVCVAISLINYAINFFIYILSGKSFRMELRKIFNYDLTIRRSFTARSTREEFLRL